MTNNRRNLAEDQSQVDIMGFDKKDRLGLFRGGGGIEEE
jgi:hypothetical protein